MRTGLTSVVDTSKGVVLAQKLYNPLCPSDDFLSIALIQVKKKEWIVWNHNSQNGGFTDGSFFQGDYFTNEKEAWDCFNRRGRV